jgi:hypothetical protein
VIITKFNNTHIEESFDIWLHLSNTGFYFVFKNINTEKHNYCVSEHYPFCPTFFKAHNVSITGFRLHLQEEPTQLGQSIELIPISGHQHQVKDKSKSHYDRQSVGQSVLVSDAHLGAATNFSFSLKFYLDSCGFVIL